MTSNYTVTVLGLGAMGLPMATRLASQLTVHGFDIAGPRLKLAEEAGIATFATAREAAKGADAVLLAVRNGEQLNDVLFGETGVASVLEPGAVVNVVNRTLKIFPPRFVIAKGGITSSDVAAHGLEIRHAIVRGPMLPGIVSLWEPVDGPAKGIPYIVFAGNVGDDQSLADVTRKLSNTF